MVCPPDEVPLWAFGIVVVPISLLIGIATTTIGFTAWTIIVPLFFAGFKKKNFSLFETIFMSVLLDCINSALATLIFAKQSKVDWPVGLIFACIAIVGSLFGLVFSNEFLLKYQEIFKRGLGFISLVIGLSFFFKGYMKWRSSRNTVTANLPTIPSNDLEEPQRVNSSKSVVQTESSHLLNTEGGLSVPSSIVVIGPSSSPAQYQLDAPARILSDSEKAKMSSEVMENARQRRRRKLRMMGAVAATLVAGVASGLIGFGGGMIFVLLFMGLLQKEQLVATGTGCFVMCTLTGWLALIYETGGHWLGFAEEIHFLCIWEELLMLLLGGIAGTILGSFFILRISPIKLNLLVGTVLFVTGLVATLQARVFPTDDDSSL